MNENQLDYFIVNVLGNKSNTYYKGVYCIDEVLTPKLSIKRFDKNKNFSFIFNTLKRTSNTTEIGHWLSCIILFTVDNKSLKLRFFDSYAKPYNDYGEDFKSYVDRMKLLCLNNGIRFFYESVERGIQPYNTLHCGIFVSFIVINAFKKPYQNFKTLFLENSISYKNRVKNNQIMELFLKRYWPVDFCKKRNPQDISQFKIPLNLFFKRTGVGPHVGICPKLTYQADSCLNKCKCINCIHH